MLEFVLRYTNSRSQFSTVKIPTFLHPFLCRDKGDLWTAKEFIK